MSIQEIIVGSTSEFKLDAVAAAWKLTFRDKPFKITGKETLSGQSEQPLGFEEIFLGARMRARNVSDPKAISIGIENGIIRANIDNGITIDLAVIYMVLPDGRELETTSPSIRFPEDCVIEAVKRGLAKNTVGSIIRERIGGIRGCPHSTITQGNVTRKDTLIAGLSILFKQI